MQQSASMENGAMLGMPPPVGVRALLLDDSSFDRARIRRMSTKSPVPVQLDEVGSIEELDHAVHAQRYDLILIDYRLPVGNGMQALDHILNTPKNRDAGKIMITGDCTVDTAVQALRGGCHDFLNKSEMTADVLNTAMTNALTLSREKVMTEASYQQEMLRQGLVAALMDERVTGNVVSLVKEQLSLTQPDRPLLFNQMDTREIDALLSKFEEDDVFIFH